MHCHKSSPNINFSFIILSFIPWWRSNERRNVGTINFCWIAMASTSLNIPLWNYYYCYWVHYKCIWVSLTAWSGMFSWHAWPTIEWHPQMQVMVARNRLKFSCAYTHPRTVLYAMLCFLASSEASCLRKVVVSGLVLTNVLNINGVKEAFPLFGFAHIFVVFGLFMLVVTRGKGIFCLMVHLDWRHLHWRRYSLLGCPEP